MATILECLRSSINSQYIPLDQVTMSETIDVNGVEETMTCEICPKKRNQEWLLASFDKGGDNKLLFPYFLEIHGLVCMCDYFVFIEEPQRLTVVAVELKHHLDSPEPQIYINMPFARFIIDRLQELYPTLFDGVTIQYRGIGVKKSFWQKSFTQGYVLSYNEKHYALLPNPLKMHLALVCDS